MAKKNSALESLQTSYIVRFVALLAAFVVIAVLYAMGFINYGHGWVARIIGIAILAAIVWQYIVYMQLKSALLRPARRTR